MKKKFVFTFLLIILLIGCSKQPNLSSSIPLQESPSQFPSTETVAITVTSLHQAPLVLTVTPIPSITNIPKYTQTKSLYDLVDTHDGKQFISNKYGFTITFPSDIDVQAAYPTNDALISGFLPQKHLADGGDIVTWFGIMVENQTNGCYPKLIDSASKTVKVKQVTLGSNPYTKIYTPNLYGNYQQDIEYMTYDTDFCVHFSVSLQTYYFDQGDAQPGNMLPYRERELDHIVSTFRWVKP